jgi:hypothetical protein
MAITFRPGLLPPDPSKRRLHLAPYLQPRRLPEPPSSLDWDHAVSAYGVLANDRWGDCAWAAPLHAIQRWTANASAEVVPSDSDAVNAYAEGTGFDPDAGPPGDNPTDRGSVMQDVLSYWRRTGILIGSERHRILAFAQVNHRDQMELRTAAALFGDVQLGFDLPDSAVEQTNAGQPWDVVAGARVAGGHAVCSGRYYGSRWWVVSWGVEQEVTSDFMACYLSEAWVAISPEWVRANGTTPSGLDIAALGHDFSVLTGDPAPFPPAEPPSAPPPGAAPFPAALVAAVEAAAGDPQVAEWLALKHYRLTASAADHLRAILAARS